MVKSHGKHIWTHIRAFRDLNMHRKAFYETDNAALVIFRNSDLLVEKCCSRERHICSSSIGK